MARGKSEFVTYFSTGVVICPPLPSPANGRVSVGPRTPGSVANYSCNTGYQLEGSVRRTCLNDGTWSEREPICIGIYILHD